MLYFKTDRQKKEWESGKVNFKLIHIINWLCEYLKLTYPSYKGLTLTDIFRTQKEQDNIYQNHNDEKIQKKYLKSPWQSVHQYWRGVDIRTSDMPGKMAYRLSKLLEQIPYDRERPRKKTAVFHNIGTGEHCHLQVMNN